MFLKEKCYANHSAILRIMAILFVFLFAGCDTTVPQAEPLNFMARVQSKTEDGVRVSSAVLSPEESALRFSMPLAKQDIQPVWVEIENRKDKELYLMLLSVDPNYFSPAEVAWRFRASADDISNTSMTLPQKVEYFFDAQIPIIIKPRSTVSGFVYTNLDPGRKAYSIEIIGKSEAHAFEFFQEIPGFESDYSETNIQTIYSPDKIKNLNLAQLRQYLEDLPCCASGGDRKTPGDPLNLVIVGRGDLVFATMARRGWDFTETARLDSIGRTVVSSLFKSNYRTSPVSPLYLFGRRQDAALQKVRATLNERNHLRLWRAPVNLDGEPVWVGQISRDIGVKLSSVTFISHKIDPIVDEARLYVTLDTIASRSLRAVGYVSGVGFSDRTSGRINYTKDPYYTDGNRVVLILSDEKTPSDRINYLPWEQPPGRN
ncbi:LssY C-terminal domain-containing protein [Sulfitobacter sp. SK012]|uniref:LssY C-terminal domain-containing protein n=1 Tax=Sulfitobacter sp. SK012 TaxID=1389005 RepID=UPI0013B3C969|nr:LssY C-terminal domain-containing protein [Sulfitobacter sp. SK012]